MFKKIDKFVMAIMALIMLALVCSAVWQVFTRFVLKSPSLFTEEFSRYALIWATMLGAAYAFSKDMHLSLVLVKDKVKGKAKSVLFVFNELVVWFFAAGILFWGGMSLCTRNTEQVSAILRVPMNIIYAVIPIAGVIIMAVKLVSYYRLLTGKREEETK